MVSRGREVTPKFVTVFRGARDRYQVPLALYEHGYLERHISEWYSPLDLGFVSSVAAKLPPLDNFLKKRYCPNLPSAKIKASPKAFVRELVEIIGRGHVKFSHERSDAAIGWYAGEYARKHDCALLAYSYCGYYAFRAMGKGSKRLKVLFQVHPHPHTARRLLAQELRRNPDCRQSLMSEQELQAGTREPRFRHLSTESKLADLCITGSSFTKRSLVENGIAPNKVVVVPYGVDLEAFKPQVRPDDGKFRVLFVGSLVQRKGIKYLLEAWKALALPNAELVLVGRSFVDTELPAGYNDMFTHIPHVSQKELAELYGKADLFCFPSIVEGFGLVILEALACGTPVVTTTNTAGPDILEESKTGFILEPTDLEGLTDRLRWCYTERNGKLVAMRPLCRQAAERYTWPLFRERLACELARFAGGEGTRRLGD